MDRDLARGREAGDPSDDDWPTAPLAGWDNLPPASAASAENPWAWASEEAAEPVRADVSGLRVTAVLVTFDAARWLPATLQAIERLQPRPARIIAIDNGSTDATPVLLARARDTGVLDALYQGGRDLGFGAAVAAALRDDRAEQPHPVAGERGDWLWLLHDDAEPAPDALYQLLAHVVRDRSVDVTGPKLLLPRLRHGGQPLSEVGVSISGTGRRELFLDPGEIDQGQRDLPAQRLGVSTCGMLVRAEVWRDLDGLDPVLPVFRDGVEFGWRAHLNGYRVVTTPTAEVTHRQVGRAGLRPRGITGRRPERLDRTLGMVVVAAHAPGAMLPLVWLRLVWGCLVRAIGYLGGKVPARSLDELAALGSFVAHPGRIRALRRRAQAIEPAPGSGDVVRSLRPPWWSSLRVAAETLSTVFSERYRAVAGDLEAASLDELTGDDFSSSGEEPARYPWLNPAVLTVVVAVLGSLVAARQLFGSGRLAASALLPAQSDLAAAWHAAVAPIAGAPDQIPPPWLTVVALASTVLAGQPDWFTVSLICGVVPLTLLAAYPAVRHAIGDRRLRVWVAGTYALLPVLLGGSNQGRLALSVVAIGLPLLITAVRALVLRRVKAPEAWRGGWGAGVVLAFLVAFEPSLYLLAVVLGGIGAVVLRRAPRKIGRIGIALGLPAVLLLPWWPSLIARPGRLLVGPDAALDGAGQAPSVGRLLIGQGLGPGQPPLWLAAVVFGVIWLVALLGLVNRPDRRLVIAAWTAAVLALAFALLLSRAVLRVPPTGVEVRPWVGCHLLIAFGALVFAAGVGLDGLTGLLRERSFGWLQPAALLSAVLVAAVSAGAAVWWVAAGATGPVERSRLDSLPPYIVNAMRSDAAPRVLAVDLADGTARYVVLAGGPARLGDADRGGAFGGSEAARAQADDLVVRLVAGTADSDITPQLRDLGVGYVFLTGADDEVTLRIGNTPGLGTASGNERGDTVWQLQPAVSRAAVQESGQRTDPGTPARIAPGPEGRVLLIGEPADPRWRAELDGTRLTPATDRAGGQGGTEWQQGFALPAAGGVATWSLPSALPWLLIVQGLLLAVAAVLAAPAIRRPEVRDPTRSSRRAATLSELG